MATLKDSFRNVFSYAAGMQAWVKDLFKQGGHEIKYTFAQDFAIADWMGDMKDVRETMERVRSEWASNWRAQAQAVAQLSAMADAHYQLQQQGISGRTAIIDGYHEVFNEERDKFNETFADNNEAKSYLFELYD